MTEFEMATLALQEKAIWVAGAVGIAQCLLIGGGLVFMGRGNKIREQRHRETMTALQALIRSSQESQAQTAKALDQNIAALKEAIQSLKEATQLAKESQVQTAKALDENITALREVIRRTGGEDAAPRA